MAVTTRLDGKRSFKKPFGELRDGQPRPLYDRIYIDPEQNVIIGSRNIARYLGVTSLNTIWSWTELYGLPIIKRPDGLWMTTMTAIDQWIFIAASIIEEQREKGIILSKGSIRTAAKRAAQGTGAIPLSKAHQNTSNRMAPIPSPGMYERDRLRSEAEQTALINKANNELANALNEAEEQNNG